MTKAKKNIVAYEKPELKSGTRGRPRKRGAAIKLHNLFVNAPTSFHTATVNMYGKREEVELLVIDLLWGQGFYRELRFVLVKHAQKTAILVSTDVTLAPESIIEIYALRFKIETNFRELKQTIAGFAYRFWTSALPKLNRFDKNTERAQQIIAIQEDECKKTAIVAAFNAIEGFAMFALIALGLLQIGALSFGSEIDRCAFRWLRTKRKEIPSEATTADFLRKTIFHRFYLPPDLAIAIFIRSAQDGIKDKADDSVA